MVDPSIPGGKRQMEWQEMAILQGFPMTFHPSDWYFSRTLIGLALCLGLAVYGFHTSLGGKSVFGGGRRILSFSDE